MDWNNDSIFEAVAEAKRNNKLFLVFVQGPDKMSEEMTNTYNDPGVAGKLSSNIIAVKLMVDSLSYKQFCEIYPVLVIPSSFFIGVNGAPLEIITGSLSPSEFSNRIDKLLEVFQLLNSSKNDTASTSSAAAKPSTSQNVDYGRSTLQNTEPASTIQNEATVPQPSTSHVDHAEATPSLEDKIERAKALVEAQRQSKALEEQEEERKRELDRRSTGKVLQEAEKAKHDRELREWAKGRAKEKEEEKVARERVKAMIAQDRAERAAKFLFSKEAEEREKEYLRQVRDPKNAELIRQEAELYSNTANIQFRLSNGSFRNNMFQADDTLADARRFVIEEIKPPYAQFAMCTTYPRRHFTESDFSETLRNLGLSPSAVILIIPSNAITMTGPAPGFFTSMFWMLLLPVTSVWNYIHSFFRPPPPPPQGPAIVDNPRVGRQPSGNRNPPNRPPNRPPQREPPFSRREGNVFRMHNSSDDDENNTWNGNSTQQM